MLVSQFSERFNQFDNGCRSGFFARVRVLRELAAVPWIYGRDLTDDEMRTVKELVRRGLEGWYYILEDAVIRTHAVNDPWYWAKRELKE